MTDRRKYVIISDSADPDYLDDIEETFVRVNSTNNITFHTTENI